MARKGIFLVFFFFFGLIQQNTQEFVEKFRYTKPSKACVVSPKDSPHCLISKQFANLAEHPGEISVIGTIILKMTVVQHKYKCSKSKSNILYIVIHFQIRAYLLSPDEGTSFRSKAIFTSPCFRCYFFHKILIHYY